MKRQARNSDAVPEGSLRVYPEHSRMPARDRNAKSGTEANQKTKTKGLTQLQKVLVQLGAAALVLFLLFQFLVTIRIWHENDMYPTVRDGELTLFLRPGAIENDTVVLYRTEDGKEHLGRVVALEGELVDIKNDTGVSVDQSVIMERIPYQTPPGKLAYPYAVPESSYFILNDYRSETTDSRDYGAIPKKDIIGVLIFAMQYRGF